MADDEDQAELGDEVPPPPPPIRPFAEFLVQQARGSTHGDLSQGLHDLIESVKDVGKGGRLTLTIDVKPLGKGSDRTMIVTDSVTVKLPKGERPQSIFFVDDDGNLTRDDPHQMKLPLREAEDRRAGKAPREAGAKQ